jgi:hypothetical protein
MRKPISVFWTAMMLIAAFGRIATAEIKPELKAEQHQAAVTILFVSAKNPKEAAGCSATAVSEHVLLTAEHCNVSDGVLYLNQTDEPFYNPQVVTERYFDHHDHMLLVVPGVVFKHFAYYDPASYRPLGVGEHFYFWGNPGLITDQYREGYVTGTVPYVATEELDASGSFLMEDSPVVGGDSGSVVYSAIDGRVVGVTTYTVFGGLFGGQYPLAFTAEQVAQAEGRGAFTYLPDSRPIVNVSVQVPAPHADPVQTSLLSVLVLLVAFYVSRPVLIWLLGILWKTASFTIRSAKAFWRGIVRIYRLLQKA